MDAFAEVNPMPGGPALPPSARLLGRVFDRSPYSAFLMDGAGRVLAMNRHAIGVFGDLVGHAQPFAAYPPWCAIAVREHALPGARERGYWRGELEVRGRDGALHPVSHLLEFHPARGHASGGETEFFSCALYPLLDQDAYQSRLRFKRLFEAHPHPVWVYDLDSLRFLVVNAAAVAHYGYDEARFLELVLTDIEPPGQSGVRRHRRRDGGVIMVELSSHALTLGGRAACFVFAHDVTERLRIETALHESEEMQQHVINHIPHQIFWKDLDLRYRGCNNVFARAAGLASNADVVGKDDHDFPWSHSAERVRDDDRRIIASGAAMLNYQDQMVMGDGLVHWFLINKLPLHDQRGQIVGVLGTIEDVTERKQAELTLQLRGRAIEASVNAIVITASSARGDLIEYANPAFTLLSGYRADEYIGRGLDFLLAPEPDPGDAHTLRRALGEHAEVTVLLRNYHKDGALFWNQLHVAPVRNAEGAVSHHVCVLNDMTATMRHQSQLEHQANHDALTELPNRNLFADRLEQAISYAQRYRHAVWVLFIDLDNFKLVNDSLGHHCGDELLRTVAARLRACVRDSDTVGRLGGDEFMLILLGYPHGELSSVLLKKLLKAVADPVRLGGREVIVTCSIGVSLYPNDGEDAAHLLKHADIAMYRAKEAGRNQIQFYEASMNARIAERALIESELRNALARGELGLHYQPRVDLRSGRVVGVEALLRWRHPQLGMVLPSRFIGVAEETGMIVPIGAWVLRTACAQTRAWQLAGLAPLRMAVNLSARQFRDHGLGADIVAALRDSGLDARYLELELTESVMMQNVEQAVATLVELKRLGIALSIDDFGTGYSSLAYLKLFPLDYLKIDQSFVQGMLGDPSGAAIVRSVIALGHSLDFKIIAEGVESAAQLAYLRRYGCDEMQGYHFSRPLPAEQLFALLQAEAALEPAADTPPGRRTLLLLDDEPRVIASLARLLRRDGYHILRANTTEQAFALLAMHEVQVIVSDQRMPDMNGTEFLSRVKKLYPGTIRIILSGYTELESVLNAINRGEIYRFYTKPWDDLALRQNIEDAFAYHQLIHGMPSARPEPAGTVD